MEELGFVIGILCVVALGLSAGALLAEACILVPMWRSQEPEAFLDWYREHAALLLRFFGPLEVASLVLVVAATTFAWLEDRSGLVLLLGSTGLTLAVLASFPLYFKKANASFAEKTIQPREVGAELVRWGRWHWARTVLAILAILLATVAIGQ